MRRISVMWAAALAAAAVALPDGIPDHFAPFGPDAGDNYVWSSWNIDAEHTGIGAKFAANVLGRRAATAFVSANGWVTFGFHDNDLGPQPHSPPFQLSRSLSQPGEPTDPAIAVIWGDLDTRMPSSGKWDKLSPNVAYFRTIGKDKVGSLVRDGLTPAGFVPTAAFVATWYEARCYPAQSSESQKRAVTAQLVLLVDGSDPTPKCNAEECLGRTIAIWRFHGLTVPNATFGAGIDNGIRKTGAMCYTTQEDPQFNRDDCDVALLPLFAERKAPKRMQTITMTTEWGTVLNPGEFAYRIDRPFVSIPVKRNTALPRDPSVPNRVRNILPPGWFAGFGPAAGDKALPSCSGECFAHDTTVDFRANILGQKPSVPLISNFGYVDFRRMSRAKNPTSPGLGYLPKAPPFRDSVTNSEKQEEAPAVVAPLWGHFDTSLAEYAGTAPRPNTVYFRQVGRRGSAEVAGPARDWITGVTGALIVTWYRIAPHPAPAPTQQAAYSSAQLVLLMNGTMYSKTNMVGNPGQMGQTVGILRYDAGTFSNVTAGVGLSGGMGDPSKMCQLSTSNKFRFDPERCDGFTLPRFGEKDIANKMRALRQPPRDPWHSGFFGNFKFRLDRKQYTRASAAAAPTPAPEVATQAPTTLPPVTEAPSPVCAAIDKTAVPVDMSLHPMLRIVTLDRTPEAFAEIASTLMCLPKKTQLAVTRVRFWENGGGLSVWEAKLSVPHCLGYRCLNELFGRLKAFSQLPIGAEAKEAGLMSSSFFDDEHPWVPVTLAPTPAATDPIPEPSSAPTSTAAPAASPSCSPAVAPVADADAGLALVFTMQPSLQVLDALVPYLCLPADSTLEFTPIARIVDGYFGMNVFLRSCGGALVNRSSTVGCPAEAAGRLKAFASTQLPDPVQNFGIIRAHYVARVNEQPSRGGSVNPPPVNCSVPPIPLSVKHPRLVMRSIRIPISGLVADTSALLCLETGTTLRVADPGKGGKIMLEAADVAYLVNLEVNECRGESNHSVPGFAECVAGVAGRMAALVRASPRSNVVLAIGVISVSFHYDKPLVPVAPEPTRMAPTSETAIHGGFFSNPAALAGVAVGASGLLVAVVAVVTILFVVRRRRASRSAVTAEEDSVREAVVGAPIFVKPAPEFPPVV